MAMITGDFRKWLSFGAGVGIEVAGEDLLVTGVRVRPNEVRVLGSARIARFRERPAADWGAEYAQFLKEVGCGHLAATVLLPRDEMIVRQLSVPGVSDRDLGAAIRYQADALHPYPEDEVTYGWCRVPGSSIVLVGIARLPVIQRYSELFSEVGIRVASLTFSAVVIYSAARVLGSPPASGFLILEESGSEWEVYGESPSRPLFSAAFDMPPERVVDLVTSDLRLPPDAAPSRLRDLLPAPRSAPETWDPERYAPSYATALASACPWLSLEANLLPKHQRSRNSRLVYAPTAALAGLLIVGLAGIAWARALEERELDRTVSGEIARYAPDAARIAEIEAEMEKVRGRRDLLREFRGRTRGDLDLLLELSNRLEPPAWLRSLQLTRANVAMTGEAPAADKLLGILDASPLLENSEFTSQISSAGKMQSFSLRAGRKPWNPAEPEPAGQPPSAPAAPPQDAGPLPVPPGGAP